MSRWVEVHHTHDDQELPGEGVEYITAADEERRRINRERQRRFRERVKAGAKIAVYRPRQPGATKAYTRRTKVDRGCNCTLQTVSGEEGSSKEEEKMLRAMGIRYMLDTETGETYTLPDPLSKQWRTTQRKLESEARRRTPQGVADAMEETARMVRWIAETGRWSENEAQRVADAAAEIMTYIGYNTQTARQYSGQSEPDDYNPIFEERRELPGDDVYRWELK